MHSVSLEAKGAWKKLKKFDLFPKSFDDIKDQTPAGAVMSIIGGIFILFLLISEFQAYWYPVRQDTIMVDVSRGKKLPVRFDIIFPNLLCDDVRLDVVDDSGEHISTDLKQIDKTPIAGERELATSIMWNVMLNRIFDVGGPQNITGCRLRGAFDVEKTKGNFHVAAGSSHSQQHSDHKHHVHRLRPQDLVTLFNISHRIIYFGIGAAFPGSVTPLSYIEHFETTSTQSSQMTYFIKIVPTVYESTRQVIDTYQYTYSVHKQYIDFSKPTFPLPGLFFKWDLSPFMIKTTSLGPSFANFLTRVCAVLGGSFVVIGLIYRAIYRAYETLKEKIN